MWIVAGIAVIFLIVLLAVVWVVWRLPVGHPPRTDRGPYPNMTGQIEEYKRRQREQREQREKA